MMQIAFTIVFALAGLTFGSFLNVCASRWPEGESMVMPRSHCRACKRQLAWWENIPVLSWLALRGRCRSCHAVIGIRYPLAEAAVAATWAFAAWNGTSVLDRPGADWPQILDALGFAAVQMAFCWLLILLATLDAEHFWLPDRVTLTGAALGGLTSLLRFGAPWLRSSLPLHWSLLGVAESHRALLLLGVTPWLISMLLLPGFLLLIRWGYGAWRGQEGVGLGDIKLMLLLSAWMGLSHALLAFFLGISLGAIAAIVVLLSPQSRDSLESKRLSKIPLGTFLCIGGILSAFWGRAILTAYLTWSGF
jgi:leader peptidase (prepilin peptidase)/N-methyltransferase